MVNTFHCNYCNYETPHKAKHERHVITLKHLISEYGIVCCGLNYYEKHKWVNHKKSLKHHLTTLENNIDDSDPYQLLDIPLEKKDLILKLRTTSETTPPATTQETTPETTPETTN